MVSHDQGDTWMTVPADGPSEYVRRYERRPPRAKDGAKEEEEIEE